MKAEGGIILNATTEFLINMRKIIKLHEGMLRELGEAYEISLLEVTIISFLHNNPGKDTAGDIVELRMLQKSNVSQAVELLYKKGLLTRQQDSGDRRRIHLFLTEKAKPMTDSMDDMWKKFEEKVFEGISREEQRQFEKINEQIKENICSITERSET